MEGRAGKRLILAGLFLTAIAGWECSPRLLPLSPVTSGELSGGEWAKAENGGIIFAARPGELDHCSLTWERWVTTFEVRVENRTPNPVTFPAGDFILRDGEGRQFQSVDLRDLAEMGIPSREGRPGWPVFHFGLSYRYGSPEEALWGAGFPIWYGVPAAPDRCPEEVFLRGLSPEPVEPAAFVRGLVFFRGEKKAGDLSLSLRKDLGTGEPVRIELDFRYR